MSRTIIIIGAGPAGLTAALELLRLNRDDEVFVLEAEDAVGGLAKTINWNGNRFDLGGHRFFSKDDRVNDWWNSIMPMPVVKRKSSIFYNGELIDYPLKLSYKVIRQLGIRKIYRAVRSYIKSQSIKREIASLEDFYISRFGEELYHLFFHDYTLKVWGINPSNIAAEWGPQRIEGVSLGKAFLSALTKHSTEKSMTDHFFFPSEGCGAFWDKVAEEIQHLGGHIITSCEVRRIISIENRITEVICSTPTGEWKIQGGIFFSSLPIRELCLKMSNTVPRVESIAKRLHYRDMVVVGVLLDKAKCANTGLIISKRDEQWIYIQDSEVRFGRIQIINNWSTNMVEHTNDSILIILEYLSLIHI